MAIFTDDAPHVAGTVITLTILGYLTFGLRVYVRTTRAAWGVEDWLMTVATVCRRDVSGIDRGLCSTGPIPGTFGCLPDVLLLRHRHSRFPFQRARQ